MMCESYLRFFCSHVHMYVCEMHAKGLHTEAVIQALCQMLEGYQALLEVLPAHLPHCILRPWECTSGFLRVSLAFTRDHGT